MMVIDGDNDMMMIEVFLCMNKISSCIDKSL